MDLLKRYTGKAELRRTNQVYCETCDKRQDADKNLELLEGPKILVMQLMRFKKSMWSRETGALLKSVKLKQHIKFQREMEIERDNAGGTICNTESYKLRGVIVHVGEATGSGHYVAYLNNNDQWTEWSYDKGKTTVWEEVKTKEAYILIWKKKEGSDIKDPAGESSF